MDQNQNSQILVYCHNCGMPGYPRIADFNVKSPLPHILLTLPNQIIEGAITSCAYAGNHTSLACDNRQRALRKRNLVVMGFVMKVLWQDHTFVMKCTLNALCLIYLHEHMTMHIW